MAWIYFQDTAESQGRSVHGSEQSPIVKTTHTASSRYCPKCSEIVLTELPSGMTCPHCASGTLGCVSTSSSEAGPARATLLRDLEQAWITSSPHWPKNSFASFGSFDHSSATLKTSQESLALGWTPSLPILPRMGTWDDTGLYHVRMWARRGTNVNVSGLLLPTPVASEATKGGRNKSKSPNAAIRGTLAYMARHGLLPTPTACEGRATGGHRQKNGSYIWKLTAMARKGLLPTPTARDWKDGLNPKRHGQHYPSLPLRLAQLGLKGYLNPRFSERMMGLPSGSVKLKPWAAELFRKSREKHSAVSSESRQYVPDKTVTSQIQNGE